MRVLLLTLHCLLVMGASATVIVVDANGNGDFSTISDGVTGSTANDTLYLVGNGASYGNFSLASPRTIIGNGYFGQATGINPSSRLGNITLSTGATGSVFISLELGTITFSDNNITFKSCYFTGSSTVGSSIAGIQIKQSLFTSPFTIQGVVEISQSIFNYSSSGNVLSLSGGTLTMSYNTFYDGNLSIATATVSNCIVNSSRVSQVSGTIIDGVSGNKVDTETNLAFEGSSGADGQFTLTGSSSALTSSDINAASGAFGFPSGQPELAYRMRGLPEVPRITQLEFNSTTTPSSNLIIRLQAETN